MVGGLSEERGDFGSRSLLLRFEFSHVYGKDDVPITLHCPVPDGGNQPPTIGIRVAGGSRMGGDDFVW